MANMSPLFNLYLEEIIQQTIMGVKVNLTLINNIRYADDTADLLMTITKQFSNRNTYGSAEY